MTVSDRDKKSAKIVTDKAVLVGMGNVRLTEQTDRQVRRGPGQRYLTMLRCEHRCKKRDCSRLSAGLYCTGPAGGSGQH